MKFYYPIKKLQEALKGKTKAERKQKISKFEQAVKNAIKEKFLYVDGHHKEEWIGANIIIDVEGDDITFELIY